MFYTARLIDGQFGVGTESLESSLFLEAEIPWDALAFRSVSSRSGPGSTIVVAANSACTASTCGRRQRRQLPQD